MNTNTKKNIPSVWTVRQIAIGSFLSGPIGGCFLLSQNYKAFGQKKTAKKAFWIGAILTSLLIIATAFVPETLLDKLPRSFIAVASALVVHSLAKTSQQTDIEKYLQEGNPRKSYLKLFGITLILMLLIVIWAFGLGIGAGLVAEKVVTYPL